MTSSRSYYELLGVPRSADANALRRAFRSLSKVLHPDTTSLPSDEAALKFQQVCEAYELLGDPIRRNAYDASLNRKDPKVTLSSAKNEVMRSSLTRKNVGVEVRRPFSGGELFSLSLLAIVLLLSLLLGVGFAVVQGRELQVIPSWLIIEQSIGTFL